MCPGCLWCLLALRLAIAISICSNMVLLGHPCAQVLLRLLLLSGLALQLLVPGRGLSLPVLGRQAAGLTLCLLQLMRQVPGACALVLRAGQQDGPLWVEGQAADAPSVSRQGAQDLGGVRREPQHLQRQGRGCQV